MLLIGEVGTGKTTLIRTLLINRDPRTRIVRLSNPMLTLEQMLQFIAQEIRIHPVGKGKAAILQALKTYLMDPENADRIVLIFDEAQSLSDEVLEELRLLVDSTTESGHPLQIILVGQPELAQRLGKPRLRALDQRIGARAVLPPLERAEVQDYVEHHLREQGGELTTFTRGGLWWLTRLSGGIPRKINMICDHSLSRAFAEGSTVVKSRHVRAAAAEYNDVISYSTKRPFRIVESSRFGLNWPGGRNTGVVVGSVLALAAIGVIFAFAFNTRYGRDWSLPSESSEIGISATQSPSLDQSAVDEGTAPSTDIAPPSSAPLGEGLPKNSTTDETNAEKLSAIDSRAKTSETLPAALPPSTLIPADDESANTNSAPSSQALNSVRYDVKRAQVAQQSGHYDNAIWHLERAIARDPNDPVLRQLLTGARRAKAAASVHLASSKRLPVIPEQKAPAKDVSEAVAATPVPPELASSKGTPDTLQNKAAVKDVSAAVAATPAPPPPQLASSKGPPNSLQSKAPAKDVSAAVAATPVPAQLASSKVPPGTFQNKAPAKYVSAAVAATPVPAQLASSKVPPDTLQSKAPAKYVSTAAAATPAPAQLASSKVPPSTLQNKAPAEDDSKGGSIDIVKYETEQGEACMRKGDFDTALRKFRVALAMDPENQDLQDRVDNAEKIKAALANNSPPKQP
jgi:type II secretory pathway predicted ATPase ExeA/tetratricopeptide (TPR) repeat protein